jgi:hypothetical protein
MCTAAVGGFSVIATAQVPADMLWPSIEERVEQIRSSAYQRSLQQEFKKVLLDSMDQACVAQEPSVKDDAALEKLLDGVLIEFVKERLNEINLAFDTEKYNAVFNAKISKGERAGVAALMNDAQVSKYLVLKLEPANTLLADSMHEELSRIIRVWGRSTIKKSWCAVCTGSAPLLQKIEDATNDDRAEVMYSQRRTPALRKWRAIENAHAEAIQASFDVKKTFRSNERNRELGARYASRLQQVCVPVKVPTEPKSSPQN